jgi:hypothetical protein
VANAVLLKLILLLTGALYLPEELAQEIDGVLVPQGYHPRRSTLLPREIHWRLGKEKMCRSLLFSASHVACRELLDLRLRKREADSPSLPIIRSMSGPPVRRKRHTRTAETARATMFNTVV